MEISFKFLSAAVDLPFTLGNVLANFLVTDLCAAILDYRVQIFLADQYTSAALFVYCTAAFASGIAIPYTVPGAPVGTNCTAALNAHSRKKQLILALELWCQHSAISTCKHTTYVKSTQQHPLG